MELIALWKTARFENPEARALSITDQKAADLYAEIPKDRSLEKY